MAAPPCQSCHTGTALHNSGQIRFASVFDSSGKVRDAADATFGVARGVSYSAATGHGGLTCTVCHGGHHRKPHMKTAAECGACHQDVPDTVSGGPHGLHPVGAVWLRAHGIAVDEQGPSSCRSCHGRDGRGTVLSRALSERSFSTPYGLKRFARGTRIGCYSCHSQSPG